jgi:hypothetical protein
MLGSVKRMLVRCIRILEGGRAGGRDITHQQRRNGTVEVGREYPVLGLECSSRGGVAYSILREDVYPAFAPASLASEMFEIVNPSIPPWWVAADFYGTGRAIHLLPQAWADQHDIFERKLSGDGSLIPLFVQEVERIYAAEGLSAPEPR